MSDTPKPYESDTPETCEAVERWQQGKINIFDEMARLERERDDARLQVKLLRVENNHNWQANDLAEQAFRERDEARADCLEQCRLLAMGADREEKLRADLTLARKLAESAMLESDRLRAQLHKEQT